MERFMEEQIDILNELGQKTGESRTRNEVHRLGLWHRTVHIWLFDANGKIRTFTIQAAQDIFPPEIQASNPPSVKFTKNSG